VQPTYRRDPFTDEWVLIAPGRRVLRPTGADPMAGLPSLDGDCPFCPGNEAETEATIQVVPEEGDWRVRVVGNRFPLASPDASTDAVDGGETMHATGVHEVIIESRDHDADFATTTSCARAEVLRVMRERVRSAESLPHVEHVSLFRNRGRRAGSSQPHPHSQIVGDGIVGPEPRRRWNAAVGAFERDARCLIDEVLERELSLGVRVLRASGEIVVLTPFAPRVPFETWMVPRHARGSFGNADDEALDALADSIGDAIQVACDASGHPDYNLVWHAPPARQSDHGAAFWVVAIVPRGSSGAGLELSKGTAIVTVTPEDAAREMRARLGSCQNRCA
jgi:UDPglucose--hexose-1-phosphate uridylyltransferase